MMRNRFDEQLNELNSEMIRMGSLCEEVIALAAKALDEGDRALAKKVAPLDTQIDQKERIPLKRSACGFCSSSSLWRAICARFPPRSK